jgi:hypothetical protein
MELWVGCIAGALLESNLLFVNDDEFENSPARPAWQVRAHPPAPVAGAERGDTAIVYDPALEYTPQCFDPDRGDTILNPLDARMPFWTPADDLRLDEEALTLAESLFPETPYENSFFSDAPPASWRSCSRTAQTRRRLWRSSQSIGDFDPECLCGSWEGSALEELRDRVQFALVPHRDA